MPTDARGGAPFLHAPVIGVKLVGASFATARDVHGERAVLSSAQALAALSADVQSTDGPAFDAERFDATSGVRTRHWLRGLGGGPVELGAAAATAALARSGWRASDIDSIVAATSTPQWISKSFARQIGRQLDSAASAVDVRAGGAGGLEALIVGAGRARRGRVLVVASEAPSLFANPADPVNALLFGDGAAALCIEAAPGAESGLAFARSRSFDAGGTAFSVTNDTPPVFARPSRDYAAAITAAWAEEGTALRATLSADSQPLVFAPYFVTAAQLDALAGSTGLDVGVARALLAECGSLGCAAPLATVAKHFDAHAGALPSFAAIAVGGGLASCSVLWRTA